MLNVPVNPYVLVAGLQALGMAVNPVKVSRAYSGYMEYVGVNVSADRPGPPKARNRWCITSFDPFAAHTWSTPTGAGVWVPT